MKQLLKLAVLFLFLLPGCSSSRITSSWKSDKVQPQNFTKIIVLGLIRENDRHLRESMEQQLVTGLRNLGYDATCSCDEYNPKSFENMTEEQALAKLKNSGVDAVMTIVLLDKTRERYYVPGRVQYTPYRMYYNRFWGYSRTMYGRIYTEGYYTEDTKYFWETNLYALQDNELIYSAQSQSFDPASSAKMGEEHAVMLTKDMLKKKVLRDLKAEPVKKAM
ncbi:MAG: hypothetical protein J0M10_16430 [Chitinophagales bacterium]|nr:hypothetical protein [Chitinophagales bacterium]